MFAHMWVIEWRMTLPQQQESNQDGHGTALLRRGLKVEPRIHESYPTIDGGTPHICNKVIPGVWFCSPVLC